MVDLSKPYEEYMQETQPNTVVRNQNAQISMAPTMDAKTALEKLKDKNFIDTLRDYYSYRDGVAGVTTRGTTIFSEADDADLIEYFYNDRTWRNFNTTSMTKDLGGLLMEKDDKRIKQFAEINDVYKGTITIVR